MTAYVQGAVARAVPAAMQPVAVGLPRRRRDRCDAAQTSERGFRTKPVGVVSDGDDQRGHRVWSEPEDCAGRWRCADGRGVQLLFQATRFQFQGPSSGRDRAQCCLELPGLDL